MDVERRLIIMRRVMGAVGTVILEILKWILRIIAKNRWGKYEYDSGEGSGVSV